MSALRAPAAGLVLLTAAACTPAGYVGQTALCDVSAEARAEAEVTQLLPTRALAHSYACEWTEPLDFARGTTARVEAMCTDGDDRPETLIVRTDDVGNVFITRSGNPVEEMRFYSCRRQGAAV